MSANSTLAAVGNASVRNVNSNGNLSGAGTLTVVAGGQFAWNGGTGNLARLVNNGSLTFSSTVTLTGTVVDNAASGTLGLNSTLALQGGAVVNNLAAGTFTLTGQFITGPSSGPASQFNNAGILQKTSTNSFTISALLNNTGTITLGAGAAVVLGGGGTSTGTISLGSSANLFLHPGSLSYTLGNGAVVNGGTFKSTAEPST